MKLVLLRVEEGMTIERRWQPSTAATVIRSLLLSSLWPVAWEASSSSVLRSSLGRADSSVFVAPSDGCSCRVGVCRARLPAKWSHWFWRACMACSDWCWLCTTARESPLPSSPLHTWSMRVIKAAASSLLNAGLNLLFNLPTSSLQLSSTCVIARDNPLSSSPFEMRSTRPVTASRFLPSSRSIDCNWVLTCSRSRWTLCVTAAAWSRVRSASNMKAWMRALVPVSQDSRLWPISTSTRLVRRAFSSSKEINLESLHSWEDCAVSTFFLRFSTCSCTFSILGHTCPKSLSTVSRAAITGAKTRAQLELSDVTSFAVSGMIAWEHSPRASWTCACSLVGSTTPQSIRNLSSRVAMSSNRWSWKANCLSVMLESLRSFLIRVLCLRTSEVRSGYGSMIVSPPPPTDSRSRSLRCEIHDIEATLLSSVYRISYLVPRETSVLCRRQAPAFRVHFLNVPHEDVVGQEWDFCWGSFISQQRSQWRQAYSSAIFRSCRSFGIHSSSLMTADSYWFALATLAELVTSKDKHNPRDTMPGSSKQTPPYHSAPAEDVGEGNSEERSERNTCDSRRYLAEPLCPVTWRLMCRYVRSKIAQPAICVKPWIGPRNQADSQGTKRCQRMLWVAVFGRPRWRASAITTLS